MFAAGLLIINFILLNRQTFPPRNQENTAARKSNLQISPWKKALASVSLAGYGYTSMALMILYTQRISLFVTHTFGFNAILSHWLLSLYSMGSISGVLIIFVLLKNNLSENKLVIALNLFSFLALLVICYNPNSLLSMIAAFVFGFTAAGGVMQIGLNLFIKLYPHIKGRITGLYFTFGSLASFSIPIITGWLSKQSISYTLRFDLLISLMGLLLVCITIWAIQVPTTITSTRQQINKIDGRIIKLLNQRFSTVTTINNLKEEKQLPILDESRENQILQEIAQKSKIPDHTPYLQKIYQAIMLNSRAYQTKLHQEENK